MSYVVRERNESFERLLGRFKKAVQQDKILTKARRRLALCRVLAVW